MCAHVENRFFLESLSLIDCCVDDCSAFIFFFENNFLLLISSLRARSSPGGRLFLGLTSEVPQALF